MRAKKEQLYRKFKIIYEIGPHRNLMFLAMLVDSVRQIKGVAKMLNMKNSWWYTKNLRKRG